MAEPAADNDADGAPGDHILAVIGLHDRRRLLRQIDHVAPGEQYAGDIGEGVPADLDDPEIDGDGIKIREDVIAGIGNHMGAGVLG